VADKRLNVLFITKWLPSEINEKAGVFVEEFAKAVALQHNVTVLFVYPVRKKPAGIVAVEREDRGRLQIIKAKYWNFLPLPGILEDALTNWWTVRLFKRLVRPSFQPDIVHAHVFKAAPAALRIGQLAACPAVLAEHSTEFIDRQALTVEYNWLAKRVFPRFARILPVSEHLRRHLLCYAPAARLEVVPNVVDTGLFAPPAEKPANGNRPKKILTVSVLRREKAIDQLLLALGELRKSRTDFTLDIVGDGGERRKLEELTAKLGLGGSVRFHGQQNKATVAAFMKGCDLFVLPTTLETFGCVFIEALACGKPVVARRIDPLPEFISPAMGILFPPDQPGALIQALAKMLDHYGSFSSERIVANIRANFSFEAVAARLDRIYRAVISERSDS
jgi:glycosyltransferase involved in cell wall biosynthesis